MNYEFIMSRYLQEHLDEATDEMNKFLEARGDPTKPKPYKENYYFRDHLQTPKVTPVLAKPANREKIVEFVGTFLDEHSTQLSTSGPVYVFTFGEKEAGFLYELFNTNPTEVFDMYNKMVAETWDGKISAFFTGWVKHAPHKILITSILIDALQNDYDDIVTCCEYLWAFCEYAIVYRSFWRTGVKEEVMNYTIEHLGSKFKVKKVQNLQELLKYDATSSVNSQEERLKTGMDHTYTDFMYRMRNQIKNTFKNLSKAYYDNDEANATQHSKDAQFDDGSNADQEGYNTNMAQVIDKTINKFATGTTNSALLGAAAEANHIDKANLTGYVNQIMTTKENRLNKFIENVITAYFVKYPTSSTVGSGEFYNFGLALYRSLGSSKDPLLQEIRSILNFWMDDVIHIRDSYQNAGTIINYTRAIFNYIIFMIGYYN